MIYLDHHATTPCDPLVIDAMLPYFSITYANPSSNHEFGNTAADAINKAQEQLARLINAVPEEIVFTSGATESNNLAILGMSSGYKAKHGDRRKIVTNLTEHKAILNPVKHLKDQGWEIVYLPIDFSGLIDLEQAKQIINTDVFLVSVQLANSEIGTIQPISEIAILAQNCGAIFHCDAAQAIGKTEVNVEKLGIDLLSLSAHKIYGPKGIGALWIRKGIEKIINPIMFGGGELSSIRPGTLPVPLIVGFGKACEIAQLNFVKENTTLYAIRNYFERILINKIPDLKINGAVKSRLNNNSNITFPNVDSEALLSNLPDIVASTGSACESGSIEPSRVLIAIGLSNKQAFQTVRFGFGRFNTEAEIADAAQNIANVYHELLIVNKDTPP
jgi:cysteine desulfurase